MLVSIITPSYNSANTILECYKSILDQTIDNWEWLVTDDFSNDQTRKVILEIVASDRRVKPQFLNVNSGPSVARNASLDRAIGRYIAFIDSDDLWDPKKLQLQLSEMQDGKNFVFTSYAAFTDGNERMKVIDGVAKAPIFYEDLLFKRATIGCSTVMLRRSFVGDKRMPDLRSGQDYAFWLSLLQNGEVAHLLPKVLSYYRLLPNSVSRNKFKKALRQWQIYRELENLPLFYSIKCFASYAWRALTR